LRDATNAAGKGSDSTTLNTGNGNRGSNSVGASAIPAILVSFPYPEGDAPVAPGDGADNWPYRLNRRLAAVGSGYQ
jgi:hypothetical protein